MVFRLKYDRHRQVGLKFAIFFSKCLNKDSKKGIAEPFFKDWKCYYSFVVYMHNFWYVKCNIYNNWHGTTKEEKKTKIAKIYEVSLALNHI